MRRRVTVGLAAVLVASLIGPAPADAVPRTTSVVPSDALEDAGRAAMELVEARPDDYTGARITGADNRLTLALPDGPDLADREAAARRHLESQGVGEDIDVAFTVAKQSQAQLEQRKASILTDGLSADDGPISGVGEDAIAGVPIVYVSDDSAATKDRVRATVGEDVRIRYQPVTEPTAVRRLDTKPHWGGAGYRAWNQQHTGAYPACSVAFAVVIGSTRYMLTAGHCMPGQTGAREAWAELHNGTTAAYYFGTLHTTTVSGTREQLKDGSQDIYGDWSLLRGSTYESYVYSGAIDSSAHAAVGAASYSTPAEGSQVCTSGRTTAKVCRLFIYDNDATIKMKDNYQGFIWVSRIAQTESDQNLDGYIDCLGFEGGDSGGAVFQGISGRPGYVRAMGVVTSSVEVPVIGDCHYSYTKLSGLRVWNPSASILLRP